MIMLLPRRYLAKKLCFLFLAQLVTGIQVPVSDPEGTQIPYSAKGSHSTLLLPTVTESVSNGVALPVGEAPEVVATSSTLVEQLSKDVGDDLLLNSIPPSAGTPFPENHKNSSDEASSLELPPYLQQYNKYQQQYKEYLAQKNEYAATAKPFRFADFDSPQKNRFLTDGLSAYGDESASVPSPTESPTVTESLPRYKPFPYSFQNENNNLEPPEPSAYPLPEDLISGPSAGEDTSTEEPSLFPSFAMPPWANIFTQQPPKEHKHLDAHRSEISHKPKSPPAWKRIVKIISTVLPLGIFLATLTPNLIYINSTEADNRPLRIRSQEKTDTRSSRSDYVDPLIALVQKYGGLEAMEDPVCEDRFFCEMSVLGHKQESNLVEKGFWYIANETPDHIAEEVGMKKLFSAIKSKSCEAYKCAQKIENKSGIIDTGGITNGREIPVKVVAKEGKKTRKVKKFVRSP